MSKLFCLSTKLIQILEKSREIVCNRLSHSFLKNVSSEMFTFLSSVFQRKSRLSHSIWTFLHCLVTCRKLCLHLAITSLLPLTSSTSPYFHSISFFSLLIRVFSKTFLNPLAEPPTHPPTQPLGPFIHHAFWSFYSGQNSNLSCTHPPLVSEVISFRS